MAKTRQGLDGEGDDERSRMAEEERESYRPSQPTSKLIDYEGIARQVRDELHEHSDEHVNAEIARRFRKAEGH